VQRCGDMMVDMSWHGYVDYEEIVVVLIVEPVRLFTKN
jgi:hypothetical protein